MTLPKARAAALMASPEDAEARFYDALREADIERLMEVWADDEEIVCVHPGGARLVGPAAVRAGFEAIFAHGAIEVQPEAVKRVQGMGSAVHSVQERIAIVTADGPRTGWVLATNVYMKIAERWRLVAHHASLGTTEAPAEDSDPPSVLH
jgi:ketosteroid isomerase-like protein